MDRHFADPCAGCRDGEVDSGGCRYSWSWPESGRCWLPVGGTRGDKAAWDPQGNWNQRGCGREHSKLDMHEVEGGAGCTDSSGMLSASRLGTPAPPGPLVASEVSVPNLTHPEPGPFSTLYSGGVTHPPRFFFSLIYLFNFMSNSICLCAWYSQRFEKALEPPKLYLLMVVSLHVDTGN